MTRSPQGEALTDLILTMFRANNLMLNWGDRLVAPFGLTSARWQLLGAIAMSDGTRPVAWLARDLGANRQNIQRIVNDLRHDGLVTFQPNPHHKRAHLIVLTDKGRRVFESAIEAYNPGVDALAADSPLEDMTTAQRVLARLRDKLEGELSAEKQP